MEEEDHFTLTQLPTLIAALAAATLGNPSFSLLLYSHSALSLFLYFPALSRCLFIGKNGATSSNSCSTMVAANL